MGLASTSAVVRKALPLLRRRLRWLVRPPRVKGALPRMFPGGMRLDEREEQAAVEAVREVMRSKRLFRYYGVSPNPLERSRVQRLEKQFARRMGAEHALAVNSGTSALACGLAGLGIGPGDEVVVPAYTWFATASSVLAVGAVPVVAEVDESLTIDPADVERRLTPHTRAISVVHMRGAPARMDRLLELARERELVLLEDAAQAVGGAFRGRALGSIGDVGAYSFQMSKVLTAGEGGMIVTDDPAVHRRAAMYHDVAAGPELGIPPEEWLPGLNLRMSELHAAVLLVQLDRLDELLARMRAHKRRLEELCGDALAARGARLRAVSDPEGDVSLALIFFLPEAERTEDVVTALADENIPATRLYHELAHLPSDYVDVHTYPAWAPLLRKRTWSERGGPWRWHSREISYEQDGCPRTIDLLRRAVHVDVSPELSDEQVEQMGTGIAHVVERLL